jgi:hypothetical protein
MPLKEGIFPIAGRYAAQRASGSTLAWCVRWQGDEPAGGGGVTDMALECKGPRSAEMQAATTLDEHAAQGHPDRVGQAGYPPD